jgi:hypothetical protein
LTIPNNFLQNQKAASLRSEGVRTYAGMPFGLIPGTAFGFVGIPTIRTLNWRLLTALFFYLEVGRFSNLYSSVGFDWPFQQMDVGHSV